MDDEKVASIVAAGYSKAQAKQALYENDGNVDDAIDSLFLKGRKSQRNVASNPTFDDEDVTVTDDSLASGAAAVSSSGPSIFAGQFSQARRSSDTTLSQITPSLGAAVIQSSRRHSGRGDSSAAARLKAPPRDIIKKEYRLRKTRMPILLGLTRPARRAFLGPRDPQPVSIKGARPLSLAPTLPRFPVPLRLALIVPLLEMIMMI
jgi:hypothetical protein